MANKFVGVNYGIHFEDGGNAPGGMFNDNHVATWFRGIFIQVRPQCHIRGNLIYINEDAQNQAFGIATVDGCSKSIIANNVIQGFPSAGMIVPNKQHAGILVHLSRVMTHHNIIDSVRTGIDYMNTGSGRVEGNKLRTQFCRLVGCN